ncbi:MAG TPA: tryptophan 7-halogenase, partial [Gammaproteobacteria bacterium]|nr:tryptophan 7-halogenase [Gammaproteobacteria bacterium]
MQSKPTPPGKILILGGGTAGSMAAMLFAHAWKDSGVEITLLESQHIGIIAVGEGSTPKMRMFFDKIGVPESEWIPECKATYKCG